MKFVPRVNVVYHGEFHRTDEAFEIDEADAEEMGFLGCIENSSEFGVRSSELEVDTQDEPETVKPKTTSRKKASK